MAKSLKRLFDFKRLGLWKSDTSVLGIDIGTSSIKLVQLKKKGGRVVLETYGEISLGPYDKNQNLAVGQAVSLPSDVVAEAISNLMKEANVTTKRAVFSMPLKSSLLEVIEIPEFKESQLKEIIPIEARKYIPVPITEVELDWWVIPESDFKGLGEDNAGPQKGDNKDEVLIVAIHKDALNTQNKTISSLDLDTGAFEVETFSTIRSILSHDLVPTAILDLGATTSKLTIVDQGIVKLSHTINKGSQDITFALAASLGLTFEQAEKKKKDEGLNIGNAESVVSSSLEYVFHEVNRVVLDYQREKGRLISRIFLTGGGALLKGILPLAQDKFETEVLLGDPFAKTDYPDFLAPVLKDIGPAFSVAAGLALRELQ